MCSMLTHAGDSRAGETLAGGVDVVGGILMSVGRCRFGRGVKTCFRLGGLLFAARDGSRISEAQTSDNIHST